MNKQPTVEFYQDKYGAWWWQAKAANGAVTGASVHGYTRLADCERSAGITATAILARVTVPTSHSIN